MTTRSQWLAMLAKLVAPTDPAGAAKAFAAYAPMLADLPDAAFTVVSLEHVASQCKFVPSYGELRSALGPWWRDNRSTDTRAITDDRLRDFSDMDHHWLRYWNKRLAENFHGASREHVLSLIRAQSPAAHPVITVVQHPAWADAAD